MKRRFGLGLGMVIVAGLLFSCKNSSTESKAKTGAVLNQPITDTLTSDPEHYPVLSVSDSLHEFGTVRQGEVVSYSFHFKNTGSKALIIRRASSTCGCTVPEYPGKPVPPGGDGFIKVVFHSAGKSGRQVKPVFIQANTKPTLSQLTITCNVVESSGQKDSTRRERTLKEKN